MYSYSTMYLNDNIDFKFLITSVICYSKLPFLVSSNLMAKLQQMFSLPTRAISVIYASELSDNKLKTLVLSKCTAKLSIGSDKVLSPRSSSREQRQIWFIRSRTTLEALLIRPFPYSMILSREP